MDKKFYLNDVTGTIASNMTVGTLLCVIKGYVLCHPHDDIILKISEM